MPENDAENAPDAKERFRAALEHKRAQKHATNGGVHADSKVPAPHEKAGGKRTFRRKSG